MIHIKGFDALRAHVPELNEPQVLWGVLAVISGVFLLTTLFFMAADRGFAEWMPDGEIVILALGFLILSRFFSQRERYERRFGDRAYATAFTRFCVPGLGIVSASLVHLAYITGPDIPDVWWKAWLIVLGCILLLIGLVLWLRTVSTFGIDNLAMLYVYFRDAGRRAETPPYQLLRHPIYSAAIDIGVGLALIHANWYALLVALILPIFFIGWIRLIEEPDLLQRFPDYLEYRRRVPAITPKASDLLYFIRYLMTGKAGPAVPQSGKADSTSVPPRH